MRAALLASIALALTVLAPPVAGQPVGPDEVAETVEEALEDPTGPAPCAPGIDCGDLSTLWMEVCGTVAPLIVHGQMVAYRVLGRQPAPVVKPCMEVRDVIEGDDPAPGDETGPTVRADDPGLQPLGVDADPVDVVGEAYHGVRPVDTFETDGEQTPRRSSSGAGPAIVGAALLSLLAFPLWMLYRRLSDDDVLDNGLRRRALAIARDDPGATASDIARRLDVHVSTARYHLDILCEFGHLVRRRFPRSVRYFPSGGFSETDKAVADALAADGRRDVLMELSRSGELTVSDLSDRTGRAASTVSSHLGKLREAGLLDRSRDGRHVRYDLPDEVEQALGRVA